MSWTSGRATISSSSSSRLPKWFQQTGRRLPSRLVHVDFGTVLGEDNKPLKTRSGENVRLKDLLAEAIERAYALVSEKSPDFPESERRAIAAVVGVGSVQYADLAQNRSSDYVFAWDKMISLEGNTAAYLLYAVARIHSIFRKQGLQAGSPEAEADAGPPETPAEFALSRRLVKFAEATPPRDRNPAPALPLPLSLRTRGGIQRILHRRQGPGGRPRDPRPPPAALRPDGPDPGNRPGTCSAFGPSPGCEPCHFRNFSRRAGL